jgi:hypothetical protein
MTPSVYSDSVRVDHPPASDSVPPKRDRVDPQLSPPGHLSLPTVSMRVLVLVPVQFRGMLHLKLFSLSFLPSFY